ncbi:MAG TPA: glycosyltransferase, partial [Verrucomicrobiae bacterium]|nr:glycosyltransferase [Verrucomicrobiae bacterium]
YQLLVVFNGTPEPEVERFLRACGEIEPIPIRLNLGFGGGNNFAAKRARGKYLVFLNDDAVAHEGWLESLVGLAERTPDAGAVASRILFPDGTLQEAGGIIWSDGSTHPLGRGEPDGSLAYSYRRPVDYASANGLLVRRESFDSLGGFDERFFPAYYEDVDLCLGIRHRLGQRVLYEPRAIISHVEAASSASPDFRSFLFRRNQSALRTKWGEVLSLYSPPEPGSPGAVETAVQRRIGAPARVLVIDDRVPEAGLGSGFGRCCEMLADLSAAGFAVTLYPSDKRWPVTRNPLGDDGIDLATGPLDEYLRQPGRAFDVVIISRPHNFEACIEAVRVRQPRAVVIFDAEALYHRRLRIGARLETDPSVRERLQAEAATMEWLECEIARSVDRVVSVSPEERDWLERVPGHAPIEYMRPLAPALVATPAALEAREGAIFVPGWLGGDASPNVDALAWYVERVVPLLHAALPGFRTLVSGRNPPPAARALAGNLVSFTGYVDSIEELYARARIALAPVRIGAGVKIKTIEALQYGVPVVSTSVGAEGLGLSDAVEIDVSDDPAEFARRIILLATDDGQWLARRRAIETRIAAWESERASWRDVVARAHGARKSVRTEGAAP